MAFAGSIVTHRDTQSVIRQPVTQTQLSPLRRSVTTARRPQMRESGFTGIVAHDATSRRPRCPASARPRPRLSA
jgi:hypothetical protein